MSSQKVPTDPGMAGKFGPHKFIKYILRLYTVPSGNGSDLFLEETLSYRPDDKSVIARTIGSAQMQEKHQTSHCLSNVAQNL